MKAQFTYCQDVEQKRIDFFKILMADYLRVLKVDYGFVYDGIENKIMVSVLGWQELSIVLDFVSAFCAA
jgi:hypothetical protein